MGEENIKNIILEYKTAPNRDLVEVMSFLEKDYEETKTHIINLTHHLDNSEMVYNKILKEYKERTK
jgi:hypothetical protein